MSPSSIATGLLLLVVGTSAFASKEAWKSRPSVPELEQTRGDAPKERLPWDAMRFMKQSSKFVSINPFSRKQQLTVQPGDLLWSPSSQQFALSPLDDLVMGGASSSSFDNNTGKWKGVVTDANNGGFIGVRSTPSFEWNMESCNGIELKVKTSLERRRFKVVLRDSTDFNGVCWTTSIDVGKGNNNIIKLFRNDSGVTTVKIPFRSQIPTIFARTVPDQTFRKDNVVGVQLAYSKFEYDGDLNPNFCLGAVDLEILEMRAY
jgi:hypothetical protein